MDTVIKYWTELNGCSKTDSSFFPDYTNAYYYTNGKNNTEVWYYKINKWSHDWPGSENASGTGTNASKVIWDFFSTIGSKISKVKDIGFNNQIRVFPNPSSSSINIESDLPSLGEFSFFSADGKSIFSGILKENRYNLDIANIPNGLYFLKVADSSFRILKTN